MRIEDNPELYYLKHVLGLERFQVPEVLPVKWAIVTVDGFTKKEQELVQKMMLALGVEKYSVVQKIPEDFDRILVVATETESVNWTWKIAGSVKSTQIPPLSLMLPPTSDSTIKEYKQKVWKLIRDGV